MKKLQVSDVKNIHEYELIRDDWRREVIAVRNRRRVPLGPSISISFENRMTVLHQVQEMCRAERIVKKDAVQHELDVYNELLPDAGELAATLLVEITEEGRIQAELDRLVGLTKGDDLWLDMDGKRVFARFLEGQSRDDRMAAVQYLRFPVARGEATRAQLESGATRVTLCLYHPSYRARTELSMETRREIAPDLE